MDTPGFSRSQKIFLAVLAVVFFLAASVLGAANLRRPAGIAPHFDWPDETMNFHFAARFAESGTFESPLPYDNDFVRPRSFNVRQSGIIPGGFLGLPLLYGSLIKLVGVDASLFFTPLLGALALIGFASVLRRLTTARAALLGTTLLAIHPAFLYYSNYSYLPNVPFIALLVIAAAVAIAAWENKGTKGIMLAGLVGLLLGIALTIRTNEALWVMTSVALGVALTRAYRRPSKVIIMAAFLLLAFLPVLYFQRQTFGNALISGYSRFLESGVSAPSEFEGGITSPVDIALKALTLPYGFHPRVIWFNLSRSFFGVAPWGNIAIVIAGLVWLVRKKRREEVVFLVAALPMIWTIVSYGGWMIADPLMLRLNTIGLSHVRYWLPVTVFGTALLAIVLDRFVGKRVGQAAVAVFVLISLILSIQIVYRGPAESINRVAGRIKNYDQTAATIKRLVLDDAVIITDRTDKEIFPERNVTPAFPSEEEGTVQSFRELACTAPLYVYASWDAEILKQRNADLAKWLGLGDDQVVLDQLAEPKPGSRLWSVDIGDYASRGCK